MTCIMLFLVGFLILTLADLIFHGMCGHHQLLLAGLLFSVLITAILTVSIKDAVGRPRPDFFWRCFPDGVPVSRCDCHFSHLT